MDLAVIGEAIGTLGFPIFVAVAMFWFIWQIYKKSEDREDTLMEEIAATRLVNAQAIETIGKFAENLEGIKNDVNEIKSEINEISEKIITD